MEALIVTLLLLGPLCGGCVNFVLKGSSGSIIGVTISLIWSIFLLVSGTDYKVSVQWLPGYELSIYVDSISLILVALVSSVSVLIHLFSTEYMKSDQAKNRYFAKLGFFTFSMIGLLLADHLIVLFVFWELVGLASYLLIGFWYRQGGVPDSARLAFMVNRLADVALFAGILLLNKSGFNISEFNTTWMFLPSLLVTIGAFGKSAQLPFSGWLTKAMVGPTPVSALIHAATMVAAGVYLLFRVAPFMHPDALLIVVLTGTFTALYGGLCAFIQHDIKKVLAYSTISQLGYMVMGIGVGAQEASLFHLLTHAFFKAGLFLGAGSIIHYMHHSTSADAQDMRNMGGLRNVLPWTYRSFLICGLSLAGVPLFSGFMSKEGIIIAGWEWASSMGAWAYIVPDIALIAALLTAFYVGRMIILVFWGESRLTERVNQFSEALAVKLPLVILAIGSLWIFYNWNPFAHQSWLSFLWRDDISHDSDSTSLIITFLSLLLSTVGLVLAFAFFKPGSSYHQNYGQLSRDRLSILMNGFYLTNFYQSFGKAVEKISSITFVIDRKALDGIVHFIGIGGVVLSKVIALIDRFLVDGPINLIGYLSGLTGRLLAGFSSRDLQTQLAWLLVGIILILSWILFF